MNVSASSVTRIVYFIESAARNARDASSVTRAVVEARHTSVVVANAAVRVRVVVFVVRTGLSINPDAVLHEVVVPFPVITRIRLAHAALFVVIVRVIQRTPFGVGRNASREEGVKIVSRRADDGRRRRRILNALIRGSFVISPGGALIIGRGNAISEVGVEVITGRANGHFLRILDLEHVLVRVRDAVRIDGL